MFRKYIISFVITIVLLMAAVTIAAAKDWGEQTNQVEMVMATATPQPTSTFIQPGAGMNNAYMMGGAGMNTMGNIGISNTAASSCPMMSSSGMGSASGMSGMSGMTGMSGGSGMSGMYSSGANGMYAMNMAVTDDFEENDYSTSWSNPWFLLGWVLLFLVVFAFLVGAAFFVTKKIARQT